DLHAHPAPPGDPVSGPGGRRWPAGAAGGSPTARRPPLRGCRYLKNQGFVRDRIGLVAVTPVPASAVHLGQLVDREPLSEIVTSHAELFGVGIALLSPDGARLAASGPGVDAPALGQHHIHPLYWSGRRVADLVIGPCLRRPERLPIGTMPLAPREALAAAIPELEPGEIERVARHLERVIMALVRATAASPAVRSAAPSGPATADL